MKLSQLLAILLASSAAEASYLKVPVIKKRFDDDDARSPYKKPHYALQNRNTLVKRSHPDADLEMNIKFNQLMYEVDLEIGSNRDPVKLLLDTASSDMFVNEYNTSGCAAYRNQQQGGESGDENGDRDDNDSTASSGNNAIYENKEQQIHCGSSKKVSTSSINDLNSTKTSASASSYPTIENIIYPYPKNQNYMQQLENIMQDPQSCDPNGFFNYENSSTLLDLNLTLDITYGDNWTAVGTFVKDTVFLNGVKLPNTTFGVNIDGYRPSGILGIGFQDNQSPFQHGESKYRSFPYYLRDLGITKRVAYSFYAPYDSSSNTAITFGAYDKDGYLPESGLTLLPIIDFSPRAKAGKGPYYLSITMNSISFNTPNSGTELIASGKAAAILDTGTTTTSIPSYILNEILTKFEFEYSTQLQDYVIQGSKIPKDTAYITFNFQNALIKMPIIDFTLPVIDVETLSDTGLRALSMAPADQDFFILGDDFLSNLFFVADLESKHIAIGQVNPETPGTSMVVITHSIKDAVQSTNWDQVYGKDGITKLSLISIDDPNDLPEYSGSLNDTDIYYLGAGQPLGW